MFLKIAFGVVGVLVAVNGFLVKKVFFEQPEEPKEPNLVLLKMMKEQVEINQRMAMSFEKSVAVQEDMKEILDKLLVAQVATGDNLETAMRRQVTRRDYDQMVEEMKREVGKLKRGG